MITVPINGWTKALLIVLVVVHAYWALLGVALFAGIWAIPVILVSAVLRLWIVHLGGIYLYASVYLGWGALPATLLATPALLTAFWKSWRPYVQFERER